MARDLDIPIEIVACPTVREADGLALSSRNGRLSPTERTKAPALPEALAIASRRIASGAPVVATLDEARATLTSAGFDPVEYLELRAADDFAPLGVPGRPPRLLAAAWLGQTRLIDNLEVIANSEDDPELWRRRSESRAPTNGAEHENDPF